MTSTTAKPACRFAVRCRLPTRIASVVLLGITVIGIALAALYLNRLERRILEYQRTQVDAFAHDLSPLLGTAGRLDSEALSTQLVALLNLHRLSGLEIRLARQSLTFGKVGGDLGSAQREIEYTAPGNTDGPGVAGISVYYPSLEGQLRDERVFVVSSFVTVVGLFGFMLYLFLQRTLSTPIRRMITTAEHFNRGGAQLRFDESPQNEFGYLAKFINRSVDHLDTQKQELEDILLRVQHSETALAAEKERIQVTLNSIHDMVITTDAEGRVDYMNPAAEGIAGVPFEQSYGRSLGHVLHLLNEETGQPLADPIQLCLSERRVVSYEDRTVLVRPDGVRLDVTCSAAPIWDAQHSVVGGVIVVHDVSHSRMMARELSYQASHDSLTGLINRHEFERRLEEAVQALRRDPRPHTLMYLDLDQFKVVNDTVGHTAGDELLRQFTDLLRRSVRDSDAVARLGGDEFGVLLKRCDIGKAAFIADGLLQSISRFSFLWEDYHFTIGASIGLVEINSLESDVSMALSAADVACFAAKDAGRNRVHVYHANDDDLQKRHGEMHWVTRLNRALKDNRFRLYYQPIVKVKSNSDPHRHVEILLRLTGDDGELISPAEFIPAAERYNLMPQLDRWVVRATFELLAQTLCTPSKHTFAINLSAQSLCDPGFLQYVIECFKTTGISPDRVCFEITETAAIANLNRAMNFMATLEDMGCTFALDDFGSGFSSLAYLKNLRVDYLKIDGSIIKDIVHDPVDRAMVESTHHIGRAMGILTIAEFVENEDILKVLDDIGVHFAQGYGIARPRPVEELLVLDAPPARRAAG